jgi:hypothetical protein
LNNSLSDEKLLPSTIVILRSESNDEKRDLINPSNPFITDKTTTRAIVPTETPTIEIPDIILIILAFLLEKR